jgi:hypothetical protein
MSPDFPRIPSTKLTEFSRVHGSIDHSAVEFLTSPCQGDGVQGILEGDPTVDEIEQRLISRARSAITTLLPKRGDRPRVALLQ